MHARRRGCRRWLQKKTSTQKNQAKRISNKPNSLDFQSFPSYMRAYQALQAKAACWQKKIGNLFDIRNDFEPR